MALRAGAAFVDIYPRVGRGFGSELDRSIEGPAATSGRKAGDAAGESFAKSFRAKTSSIGESFAKVGAVATLGLTLPIARLGTDAFKAASDLNESLSKAKLVFGDYVGAVIDLGNTAAQKLGQSRQQATEAAATFGNLFTSLKIGQPQAVEMSTNLVRLASDLASLNNVDPEEALDALRSGLVGETEPLRRFAVNMNDATLQAKALALGLGDGKAPLSAAAKAQAAYALILEQTKTAQGNYALTSGDAANKQRTLTAQFENAKASLGQALLPIFIQLAGTVSKLAERFAELSPRTQKIILAVGGVLAVAGPLAAALGGIVTIVGLIASPVGLAVAAIVALGAGAFYLWQRFESLRPVMAAAAALFLGPAGLVFGLIYAYKHFEGFRNVVDSVVRFVTERVIPGVQNLIRIFREDGLGGVIAAVGDRIREALPKILGALGEWAVSFAAWVPGAALGLLMKLGELQLKVTTWLVTVALPRIVETLAGWAGAFVAWVPGAAIGLLGELAGLAIRVGGWLVFEGLPMLVENLLRWQAAFVAWVPGAAADLVRGLPEIGEKIIGFVAGLPGRILEVAADIGTGMMEIGRKMIGGIVDGLRSARQDVLDAIYDVVPGGKDGPIGKIARLSIPGLAAGGWATANMPHIVGEKGPELFIPGRSGTVVPDGLTRTLLSARAGNTTEAPVYLSIQAPPGTGLAARAEHAAHIVGWLRPRRGR